MVLKKKTATAAKKSRQRIFLLLFSFFILFLLFLFFLYIAQLFIFLAKLFTI